MEYFRGSRRIFPLEYGEDGVLRRAVDTSALVASFCSFEIIFFYQFLFFKKHFDLLFFQFLMFCVCLTLSLHGLKIYETRKENDMEWRLGCYINGKTKLPLKIWLPISVLSVIVDESKFDCPVHL